jgi:hypothetical protein
MIDLVPTHSPFHRMEEENGRNEDNALLGMNE